MDSSNFAFSSTPAIRIRSLASGSSGNAYLLETADQLLLLDCGVGIRQIQSALAAWGKALPDVTGVVISHEHIDHVRSLSSFSKHRSALFATRGTAEALGLSAHRLTTLIYGDCAQIGSVTITPIKTSHDAAEPCGLFIESGDIAIGLITDLGAVTDDICGYASRCNLLILEANHDRDMLRTGPYPAHLKRRVASDLGHLSNDQAGAFLVDVVTDTDGPLDVWLAHLSATNNTPLVATGTVIARMTGKRTPPQVCALPRLIPGPTWDSESVRKRPLQLALDV